MHNMTTINSLSLGAYRQQYPLSQVTDEQYARTLATHDVDSESGRLYPKGEYTSEDSLLGTLHMYSVEAAQLLEAGYTFTIGDTPSSFDDDSGELQGCYFDAPGETNELSNEYAQLLGFLRVDVDTPRWFKNDDDAWELAIFVTDANDKRVEEGDLMTDKVCSDWARIVGVEDSAGQYAVKQRVPFHSPANQRLGTGPDRWEWEQEIADESAALEAHRLAMPIPTSRDYGEQGAAALARYRRCGELVRCAAKLGTQLRSARRRGNRVTVNRCLSLLSQVKVGVRARYSASVELVVTRGEASGNDSKDWSWWMLYLTKAQTEVVYRAVTRALGR